METEKVWLWKTKSGRPAAWESGGGATNTGRATIVAGPDGEPLRPIYIPAGRSNSSHALFVVREGYIIIRASHHRGDFDIRVFRIRNIRLSEKGDEYYADGEVIASFDYGEWDVPPAELGTHVEAAVEAAKKKALTYHCRSAVYLRQE